MGKRVQRLDKSSAFHGDPSMYKFSLKKKKYKPIVPYKLVENCFSGFALGQIIEPSKGSFRPSHGAYAQRAFFFLAWLFYICSLSLSIYIFYEIPRISPWLSIDRQRQKFRRNKRQKWTKPRPDNNRQNKEVGQTKNARAPRRTNL